MINKKDTKLLFISLDTDLYLSSYNLDVPGDPYLRHCKYQELLRQKTTMNSEIIIIVFSYKKTEKKLVNKKRNKTIKIISTNSINRFLFTIDISIKIFNLFRQGWVPDVITSQNSWGEALPLLLFAKIINCRFIPQLHTDISSKYWIQERPFLNRFRRICSLIVFNNSSKVRVVSEKVALNISKKFKINQKRFIVAPVGISLGKNEYNIEKIIEERLTKKEFNILYIGRFSKEKDLNLWIDSALKIADKIKNIKFTLIGYGKEKQKIIKLINESNHKKKFHIFEKVNYNDLPEYLINSHLLLLTSFYEGFGRVVLEAMTFGLPCVSTKSGGTEDLIKNYLNGFIVDNRDPVEISKICIELLKKKKSYKKMSNNSYFLANEKYSFEKLSNNLIDLILEK